MPKRVNLAKSHNYMKSNRIALLKKRELGLRGYKIVSFDKMCAQNCIATINKDFGLTCR